MPSVPPSEQKSFSEFLFGWLAPIVILIFGLAIWSNHFQNGFHADDFTIIVNNRALGSLANIPRFFRHPRTFSSEPENADFRPLLSASFAADASLTPSNSTLVYQVDSFVWFGLLMLWLFTVFLLIPGTGRHTALFGAALFGLHPVAAETVNYISQRGQIMGTAGVCMALALWIVWPRRLPARLGLDLNRVPQNWWQHQIRERGPGLERLYKAFRQLPIPFYLIPLVPALLTEPSSAVFALILLAYIRLFDSASGYKRLTVPAIVCGVYWMAQTALVLRVSPLFRIPLGDWWATQPWVAMRYLYTFLVPLRLSADSGFRPMHFPQPLALAGVLGVGAVVGCAIAAGRREKWRGVAFGLWWFLAGLVANFLIPQRTAEAVPSMFFATAGLAFAAAHAGGISYRSVMSLHTRGRTRLGILVGFGAAAAVLLSVLGWMTYERNRVWQTERTLWLDVTQTSPGNGRGFIEYATALMAARNNAGGLINLRKAVPLSENDGLLQLRLAQGFDRLNKDVDAEFHFRRALLLVPRYAAVYSYFGQWLFVHGRMNEALEVSIEALALNAADLVSRHTLMELYSNRSDWVGVARMAKEALAIDPEDAAGKRSLDVSTASIDQVRQAELDVKTLPKVDDYLKLSVLYYHNGRYEECINASKEALRMRPELAEAYANIASALHTLGRDDEAIEALRQVIRLRPDMKFASTDLEILLENKARRAGK